MSVYTSIFERLRRFASRVRIAHARATGVQIGQNCFIAAQCDIALSAHPSRSGTILLGDGAKLDQGVILRPYRGRIETGIDVYLGPGTIIYGHGGVWIGKDTLISMHCRILSSNHALPPPGTIVRSQGDVPLPTRIGADVWLGAGVTVLAGVTIGDGCVVGAGAVVTKDLPPYSIAAGVPATVRGQRT